MPASVVYRYNDGVYAIDSDELLKGSAEKNILTWMVLIRVEFHVDIDLTPLLGHHAGKLLDQDTRRIQHHDAC